MAYRAPLPESMGLEVLRLIEETEMGFTLIARTLGVSVHYCQCVVQKAHGPGYMKARAERLGILQRSGAKHYRYRDGTTIKNNGYRGVPPPEWWRGKLTVNRYVFEHILVLCEAVGWDHLPSGMQVHHCNGDKLDNRLDNLIAIKNGTHQALHKYFNDVDLPNKVDTAAWVAQYEVKHGIDTASCAA